MKKLKFVGLLGAFLLICYAYNAFKINLIYPEPFSLLPKKNLIVELRLNPLVCPPQKTTFSAGVAPAR